GLLGALVADAGGGQLDEVRHADLGLGGLLGGDPLGAALAGLLHAGGNGVGDPVLAAGDGVLAAAGELARVGRLVDPGGDGGGAARGGGVVDAAIHGVQLEHGLLPALQVGLHAGHLVDDLGDDLGTLVALDGVEEVAGRGGVEDG